MGRALGEMGPTRAARTLSRLNQVDGFDCMSCAWPDPDPEHRHRPSSARTARRRWPRRRPRPGSRPSSSPGTASPSSTSRPTTGSGKQGRLTHPMVKRPGATHYEPIAWEDAFGLVGGVLRALGSPDEAVFYTSGRASNEAAFVYQLFVRAFGTNNLPDCSNMCHESSGVALHRHDRHRQGQRQPRGHLPGRADRARRAEPGHEPPADARRRWRSRSGAAPRSSRSTRCARRAWSTSATRRDPRGVVGHGTDLTDLHLPIRLGGDLALFQAIGALLVRVGRRSTATSSPPTPSGFDAWRDARRRGRLGRWSTAATGLTAGADRARRRRMLADSDATICCWAMGLTQHRNAVATIKEVVNLALAARQHRQARRRAVPGARPLQRPGRPHHGHLGEAARRVPRRAAPPSSGSTPPREHGYDTVESIHAMLDGEGRGLRRPRRQLRCTPPRTPT